MARLARVDVFASDEVAIVHVLNRTVRRCFLLGNDPVSEVALWQYAIEQKSC
ncbi:MAG: hypothetical protein NTU79_04075 [Planctomycetota bacterium]|nr:hypothetical protein [Planctomycetota bacterium]